MREGITIWQKHLAWGVDHGWLQWAPYICKKPIVHIGNLILCSIYGHHHPIQKKKDGPVVCNACCRAIEDPGDGVIRIWEIPWGNE